MSSNCKSSITATRDANNNTLYHGGGGIQGCGGRGYTPPRVTSNGNYQQVTNKVMFGCASAINDMKIQEKSDRESRRMH